MTLLERRMLVLALVLGLLTAGLLIGKGPLAPPMTAQAAASTSDTSDSAVEANTAAAALVAGSFYGANESYVAAAAGEWPQRQNNWCGIATIEVVANYTFQMAGGKGDTPFLSGGQQRIVNDLNSSLGTSQWGTPSWNGIGPGFHADIARDGGTDPRSIAWGIEYASIVGSYWLALHNGAHHLPYVPVYGFHNVIYHGSASDAVARMAATLERYQMPLSVTIAHGLHSDVVSGVYATNDPINAFPANVDAVNVWDPGVGSPGGGYQSAREVSWDNYTFNTNSVMWGSGYNVNGGYDPDPAVGIYTPTSQYPAHWIGYRTDIEPDPYASLSPDYALDDNHQVLTHP